MTVILTTPSRCKPKNVETSWWLQQQTNFPRVKTQKSTIEPRLWIMPAQAVLATLSVLSKVWSFTVTMNLSTNHKAESTKTTACKTASDSKLRTTWLDLSEAKLLRTQLSHNNKRSMIIWVRDRDCQPLNKSLWLGTETPTSFLACPLD